ncbi:Phage capsid family protein [Sporotomaculum syntrophicum]|uniref:Phage capsid family protein n=1 Tax=Sporotomaculum syntrophicum TaxID=182264 RepID=A0A9D2WQ26_9FIRM|nr:phage major capsid protein [Sporotomaculum syntrophicum]KAF1084846.1 Phage capsid family protein [Sporotomaculum syntrophicum]
MMKKNPEKEIRALPVRLEVRQAGEDGKRTIAGVIRYDTESAVMRDFWGDSFVEELGAGCFDGSLKTRAVVGLWSHDTSQVLGNTKAGTLRVNSDTTGLNFELDLPDTQAGNDAWESIRRGDVDGVSFGMRVVKDKWSRVERDNKKLYKRSILDAELYEISPVAFPAYPSNEVNCRSLEEYKKSREGKKTMNLREREARQKLANLKQQADAIMAAADDEERDLTDDEQRDYIDLQSEIRSLEKRIASGEFKKDEKRRHPNIKVIEPANEWRSLGEQLQAVMRAGMPDGYIDERLTRRTASGLNESVPSDGGFLVNQDFSTELLKRTYETGVLASRCRRIPISTNANSMKINAVDESSRATGSRWGGVRAYWAAEADLYTDSKPKFRQMELNLDKLIGLCYATDELLEDAATLESVMQQAFAEEFAFVIDDCVFAGDGAGKPLGIMKSGALVTVPKENGQAANSVIFENIVNMWARLWAPSQKNAVWLVNQNVLPQLFALSFAVGTGGIPVYMPAGGISGQPYSTLFGRPVIPIEQAETLGTTGDIVLCDLSNYLLADKGGIDSAVSIHVRFLYDEQTFKFTYRVAGQPVFNKPLTPYKGTDEISPFVALATRV